MIKALLPALSALALGGCTTLASAPPSIDALARQYLAVQLAIGEKDPGYVDAYYGPAELAEQAKARDAEMSLPMLQARVIALDATLAALPVDPGTAEASRVRYLRAMLGSATMLFQ